MTSTRELFLKHLAQTSPQPLMLEVEKAEGVWLYTVKGEKYLDLISGISVSNLGHRHPAVIEAIQEQLNKYLHLMVYGEIIQAPQVLLSKALAETLPAPLDNVYLVNSGSEAIEGAMKLAKRFTGRSEIISFSNAYHGSTHGALSMIGSEEMKRSFRPLLPGIRQIQFNNLSELDKITKQTAAVVIEPIQGEAGIRAADEQFLKSLRERCNETGTMLVFDEIQSGFGRTGAFWAFSEYNVIPDILVCAKGMGGGMPIGAFISYREIMSSLTYKPVLGHITTFGGHPVSAAASLATLKIIHNSVFLKEVKRKGELFRSLMVHPEIKEVRGKGLFMAIQLSSAKKVMEVIDKALKENVMTDWFLFCADAIRIAPPLTITDEEIQEAASRLLRCF